MFIDPGRSNPFRGGVQQQQQEYGSVPSALSALGHLHHHLLEEGPSYQEAERSQGEARDGGHGVPCQGGGVGPHRQVPADGSVHQM